MTGTPRGRMMLAMSATITIDRAEQLLRELVSRPSVNPRGRADDAAHVGEERLATLLGKKLTDLGASVEVTEVHPGRPNVVARFGGAGGGRSLMLEASKGFSSWQFTTGICSWRVRKAKLLRLFQSSSLKLSALTGVPSESAR